jgi:hypothetical protein
MCATADRADTPPPRFYSTPICTLHIVTSIKDLKYYIIEVANFWQDIYPRYLIGKDWDSGTEVSHR